MTLVYSRYLYEIDTSGKRIVTKGSRPIETQTGVASAGADHVGRQNGPFLERHERGDAIGPCNKRFPEMGSYVTKDCCGYRGSKVAVPSRSAVYSDWDLPLLPQAPNRCARIDRLTQVAVPRDRLEPRRSAKSPLQEIRSQIRIASCEAHFARMLKQWCDAGSFPLRA